MTFLWPIALGLLVPWAVACVRLARRGDESRPVPFVKLWPTSDANGSRQRGRPPVWVMLVLAGVLLTILAAAGPVISIDADTVTIFVDRGPGLTPTRLRQAFDRLNLPAGATVHVVPVPGEPFDGFDAARLPPGPAVAIETLQSAARQLPGPAVVLTDRNPDLPPGVVAVAPPPLSNAGVDRFAISVSQKGQASALVRVFNSTPMASAMIDVAGVRQAIALPPPGRTADFFVDFPTPGDTLTARLLSPDGSAWRDDVVSDDTATLTRTATPLRLRPATALSDALGRFVAVYSRHRPAGIGAGSAVIARGDVPADRPAVLLPTAMTSDAGPGTLDASHAVSRSLDPSRLTGRPTPRGPAGDGWRVLARAGDAVRLAVRESPARQVWVGFDADALANDPAYVVFWTDAFDWIAAGTPDWPAAAAGAVRPGAAGGATVSAEAVRHFSRRDVSPAAYFLLSGLVAVTIGLTSARLDRN